MNRQVNTTSTLIRSAAATAAFLLTTLVVTSNVGLADHYKTKADGAAAGATVIALRR
jgi:hypothetical protein